MKRPTASTLDRSGRSESPETGVCRVKHCNAPIPPGRTRCGAHTGRTPKGDLFIDPRGYVQVRVFDGFTVRYVPRARMVMERKLGRPLEDHEQVIHLNGDKQDDRPENLDTRHGPPKRRKK